MNTPNRKPHDGDSDPDRALLILMAIELQRLLKLTEALAAKAGVEHEGTSIDVSEIEHFLAKVEARKPKWLWLWPW